MSAATLIETPSAERVMKFPPGLLLDRLNMHFVPRRVRYITHVLCAEELKIVEDLNDACILARIKRMDERRLMRFDRFVPLDATQKRAFITAQMEWIRHERYLLGCRLGHDPRKPSCVPTSANIATASASGLTMC